MTGGADTGGEEGAGRVMDCNGVGADTGGEEGAGRVMDCDGVGMTGALRSLDRAGRRDETLQFVIELHC